MTWSSLDRNELGFRVEGRAKLCLEWGSKLACLQCWGRN